MKIRTIVWQALAGTILHAGAAPDFELSALRTAMEVPGIREASGIAVSQQDPNCFWLINDSGAGTEIHLVHADGSGRGKIRLDDASNVDWEDLASFDWKGESWILVADVGDNASQRDHCTLYLLREPDLRRSGQPLDLRLKAAWQIDFRYEGGPRDCEAVAVDPAAGKILLLSKRTSPPELHELPLRKPGPGKIPSTRRIGTSQVEAPLGTSIPFQNQPTAMDIAADQSFAVVATYYSAFVFPKTASESWSQAFSRKPQALAAHRLTQAESIAISIDGEQILLVSEGKKSPIVRYQRRQSPAD